MIGVSEAKLYSFLGKGVQVDLREKYKGYWGGEGSLRDACELFRQFIRHPERSELDTRGVPAHVVGLGEVLPPVEFLLQRAEHADDMCDEEVGYQYLVLAEQYLMMHSTLKAASLLIGTKTSVGMAIESCLKAVAEEGMFHV